MGETKMVVLLDTEKMVMTTGVSLAGGWHLSHSQGSPAPSAMHPTTMSKETLFNTTMLGIEILSY